MTLPATGSNSSSSVAGEISQGAGFNGGQSVQFGNSGGLQLTTGMTLSAWVYTTTHPKEETFVSKGLGYYELTSSYQADGYVIQINGATAGNKVVSNTTQTGTLNQWVYLTGTYNGSGLSLYVNGNLENSSSPPGGINVSGDPLYFGSRNTGGNSVTGTLDEIRISDIARSADWIRTEYSNQSTPGAFYSLGPSQ
jgi:hypothetical protein